MGRLFATLYEPVMRATEEACLAGWRAELLAGLAGDVVEVGAGMGATLPHYPAAVDHVTLLEPDAAMRARLAGRVPDPARFSVGGAAAEALPLPDASVDVVVMMLVLCSVRDVDRALAEARRVLRPGGRLVFLEHEAASDPGRLAWQRRIEPLWVPLAGNCHLTRRPAERIEAAGFTMEHLERASMRKALPWVRPSVRGIARG